MATNDKDEDARWRQRLTATLINTTKKKRESKGPPYNHENPFINVPCLGGLVMHANDYLETKLNWCLQLRYRARKGNKWTIQYTSPQDYRNEKEGLGAYRACH